MDFCPLGDCVALIDWNAQSGRGPGTVGDMLEYGARLLQRDTGKPIDQLRHERAILKVAEKRSDRNASASEQRRSAHSVGVALD